MMQEIAEKKRVRKVFKSAILKVQGKQVMRKNMQEM